LQSSTLRGRLLAGEAAGRGPRPYDAAVTSRANVSKTST
jgi:hypothetical protein